MKKNRGNKVSKYFKAEIDHMWKKGHSANLYGAPVSGELWARCSKCTYAVRYPLYDLRGYIPRPKLHLIHK